MLQRTLSLPSILTLKFSSFSLRLLLPAPFCPLSSFINSTKHKLVLLSQQASHRLPPPRWKCWLSALAITDARLFHLPTQSSKYLCAAPQVAPTLVRGSEKTSPQLPLPGFASLWSSLLWCSAHKTVSKYGAKTTASHAGSPGSFVLPFLLVLTRCFLPYASLQALWGDHD